MASSTSDSTQNGNLGAALVTAENSVLSRVPAKLSLGEAHQWLEYCASSFPRSAEQQKLGADSEQARVGPSKAQPRPQLRDALNALESRGASAADMATGIETLILVCELNLDLNSMLVALCYRSVRSGRVQADDLAEMLGEPASQLMESVLRMASARLLELSNSALHSAQAQDQVNNVRAMMLAMIDDVRVAILKLSERVVALRRAKSGDPTRRRRIARETELVFAPLARRLGIRRLKWELEDLSLRYLEPEQYHNIAKQLDGRRAERELQVTDLASRLEQQLLAKGLTAQVAGRAKNIYSIWRKMRHKGVSLGEVYDVSAVRVLVPDVAQCYAALGLIHTSWSHIPAEFDDYIAVPKDNGYRSIHTAVVDAEGFTLEVQIRTFDMHHEAELGVCAHWAYKDEGIEPTATYTNKMNWLRQVLDAQENLGRAQDLPQLLSEHIEEDRIFVYTPKGHVIDLAVGATALDFAYAIHSEVGHQCRAASVEGMPVALNQPLLSGQRIEVSGNNSNAIPERRWLDAHLGLATTPRAKEKIVGWVRSQAQDAQEQLARIHLQQLISRIGFLPEVDELLMRVPNNFGFVDQAGLLRSLALGEISTLGLFHLLLLANFHEHPPLFALATANRDAQILLSAENRDGLLRDVALLLSRHEISILSTAARADKARNLAQIVIELDDDANVSEQLTPMLASPLDEALSAGAEAYSAAVKDLAAAFTRQIWVLDLLVDIPGVVRTWRD